MTKGCRAEIRKRSPGTCIWRSKDDKDKPHRSRSEDFRVSHRLVLICPARSLAQMAPVASTGKIRTYYIAADEVDGTTLPAA